MAEITLTNENFDREVLNSKTPVLVDFWATWCGPCRMIAPFVAEVAEEYEGKLIVGKVNTDEAQELAIKYGVSAIPTLMLFQDGKAVATTRGYMDKDEIVDSLELYKL